MAQLNEFDEIRPYEPEEMKQAFEDLLNDRQFNVVMKGFAPWLPKGVRNGLLRLAFRGVKTPLDFQKRFMKPIVKYIIRKYTDGCVFDDHLLSTVNQRYTFVSNHRDIVLDSAFLDVKLVEADYPTTVEIGIGDNLLIYPWIKRLVRMNKAFTVRRGLSLRETLAASQLMSRYIHFAVTQKKENIWLAQREGRAKDSDDRTQEAVLKMLAMGGDLKELNIVPLTISYEYDPCDYLKAQEFQQKRDNPGFKKSRQDDLDNMKTGIFGYKGRVVYRSAVPVNTWIDELADLLRVAAEGAVENEALGVAGNVALHQRETDGRGTLIGRNGRGFGIRIREPAVREGFSGRDHHRDVGLASAQGNGPFLDTVVTELEGQFVTFLPFEGDMFCVRAIDQLSLGFIGNHHLISHFFSGNGFLHPGLLGAGENNEGACCSQHIKLFHILMHF